MLFEVGGGLKLGRTLVTLIGWFRLMHDIFVIRHSFPRRELFLAQIAGEGSGLGGVGVGLLVLAELGRIFRGVWTHGAE